MHRTNPEVAVAVGQAIQAYDEKQRRSSLSDKLYSALTIADEWRTGDRLWTSVVRTLYDRGWYGVAEHDGKVVAYFNGVRFEL